MTKVGSPIWSNRQNLLWKLGHNCHWPWLLTYLQLIMPTSKSREYFQLKKVKNQLQKRNYIHWAKSLQFRYSLMMWLLQICCTAEEKDKSKSSYFLLYKWSADLMIFTPFRNKFSMRTWWRWLSVFQIVNTDNNK